MALNQLLNDPNPLASQPNEQPFADLLLQAVGASSPSTGSVNLTQSDPESLRAKAQGYLDQAAQNVSEAEGPTPAPKTGLTPLQAALGLVVGGALNSQSPFTSEGTHALDAFVRAQNAAQQQAFQQSVQHHRDALQNAILGYRMAQDQAEPLQAQAGAIDRQNAVQSLQDQMESSRKQDAADQRQFESQQQKLRLDHESSMQAGADAIRDREGMENRMAELLSQTPQGRSLIATHIGTSLGWNPQKIRQYASAVTRQTPKEALSLAEAHLQQERADHP